MEYLILLSAAVATMSATLSKSQVFSKFRARGPQLWQDLLNCPWCLNHWFSLLMALYAVPLLPLGNFMVNVLAMITFSTIFVGIMLRLLLIIETEKAILKGLLAQHIPKD